MKFDSYRLLSNTSKQHFLTGWRISETTDSKEFIRHFIQKIRDFGTEFGIKHVEYAAFFNYAYSDDTLTTIFIMPRQEHKEYLSGKISKDKKETIELLQQLDHALGGEVEEVDDEEQGLFLVLYKHKEKGELSATKESAGLILDDLLGTLQNKLNTKGFTPV